MPPKEVSPPELEDSSTRKRLPRRREVNKSPVADSESSTRSAPPGTKNPNLWFLLLQDTFVDVYVDGTCSYNGNKEANAGIGVWFGLNSHLNISHRSQGHQTYNAAAIEVAIIAAQRAHEAGIRKITIKTASKFLVGSATEWIPKYEASGWKTYENKPVKNRLEFEKMKAALGPLEVILEHVPGYQGNIGNEMSDKFARKSIDGPAAIERTEN